MASGGSGSRSFEFGSDDILCSYDDYSPQDPAGGKLSDPSTKDFHESRMGRPLVDVYGQEEEYRKEDVLSAVEGCMKKYADNLLRFLEGISGRLTQLELYYYKLERSIGDLRSDMVRDQIEKDHQLKSLEKHLQEVRTSVQILKDKQELSETQKELAKLHLLPKEPTTSNYSQRIDEGVPPPEPKIYNDTPDMPNQPLALVPHQSPTRPPLQPATPQHNKPYNELSMQQPAPSPLNMQPDGYILTQSGTFYAQHQSLPQNQQGQPMQSEVQYVQPRPQFQNQVPTQQQPIPQYQQQWPQPSTQQFSQQSVQQQQPPPQAQARPQTPIYSPYPPHQPSNQAPDAYPVSMHMQVPYSTIPRPGGSRSDSVSFSYGSPGSNPQPQPQSHQNVQRPPQPQVNQSSFGHPTNKGGYTGSSPYPPQTSVPGYNTVYNTDGRSAQNFQPGSYPPSNISALQNQQVASSNTAALHPAPQVMRNHPYGEMIEKAASMGYPRDMVVSAIHMMGETGQPIDFNALLDRLNTRVVGASPRGWSG